MRVSLASGTGGASLELFYTDLTGGVLPLEDKKPTPHVRWNKLLEDQRQALLEIDFKCSYGLKIVITFWPQRVREESNIFFDHTGIGDCALLTIA